MSEDTGNLLCESTAFLTLNATKNPTLDDTRRRPRITHDRQGSRQANRATEARPPTASNQVPPEQQPLCMP